MAIQAQYPPNVLLLNRNGQEQKDIMLGGDYLLQSSQPGVFIHQPVMLDNGEAVNPRKRGRAAINLFSLLPQPPCSTVANLALQNQHPAVVSTGLRLSFEDQQKQQQQQQQQQMGPLLHPPTLSSVLSEDLAPQIEYQRDEIDQFLQAQNELLRRTLADRRQRHYHSLLGAAEESASRRLREKDVEVEKVSRRNAELEERAAYLKAEAQVWQARVRAQEATAALLQAQLQQAMTGGPAHDKRDEAGCAGGATVPADDADSAYVDPRRAASTVPPCRACRKRSVSVVLLPCRHLCLCTGCESAVDTCPLCHSLTSASVEVYLS